MIRQIWIPIIDFENFYEVSEYGDIKSIPRTVGSRIRSTGVNTRYLSEKLLIHDENKQGYLRVTLAKNGVNKRFAVHRLVAMAFIPNPENKPAINHKDGNKKNNHYSNLEWCTNSENNKHAHKTGLNNGRLGKSKYSIAIQETVITMLRAGNSTHQASRITGIPQTSIIKIKNKHHA